MSDSARQHRGLPAADETVVPGDAPSFAKPRRHRQTGFLGLMAILIGAAAALAAFRTEVVGYSLAVAATGLAAGGIGLFRATFLGRTSFGIPLLGILISFIAYVIAANNTHRLQGQYDQLRGWSKDRLPAMSLARFEPPRAAAVPVTPAHPGQPATPAPAPENQTVTGLPVPVETPEPAGRPTNRNDKSYFDLQRGWVNMKDASTQPVNGH
jgi:hypothetical protein